MHNTVIAPEFFVTNDGYKMVLDDFRPIIRKLVRGVEFSTAHTSEDLEQMLWMKLWTVRSVLECVSCKEVFALAKSILKNNLTDVIRGEKNKFDTNPNRVSIDSDTTLENLIHHGSSTLLGVFNISSDDRSPAEQKMDFEDIRNIILAWTEKQSENIQNFIREVLNPSNGTIVMWDLLCQKSTRYSGYDSIPPTNLVKHLNFSMNEFWRARVSLQQELRNHGYRVKVDGKY